MLGRAEWITAVEVEKDVAELRRWLDRSVLTDVLFLQINLSSVSSRGIVYMAG